MYGVDISEQAEADLREIIDHYNELGLLAAGLRLVEALTRETNRLTTLPHRYGRLVIGDGVYASRARFIPCKRHKIVFVVMEDERRVAGVGFAPDRRSPGRLAARYA